VAYGLKTRKVPKPERDRRVAETLAMIDMERVAKRFPGELSGGQQQRVAIARALVFRPRVLLFDEPLSNLDAQLRERMREEIREVQQKLGITAVYVTHDQNEALAISDCIMLMEQGEIVEMGAPQQIYGSPRSAFTATFVGIANDVAGTVRKTAVGTTIETPHGNIVGVPPDANLAEGQSVQVFLRPENFVLHRTKKADNAWTGTVSFCTYQGDCWDYHVESAGTLLRVRVHKEKAGLKRGDVVYLEPDADAAVVMLAAP
jgi:ABC-type Fe3+/spermidine/putrescine transport system ATPase subunit